MFKEGDKIHFKDKPGHTYTVEEVGENGVKLKGTNTFYSNDLFEPEVTPAELTQKILRGEIGMRPDMVNQPLHYQTGLGVEVLDIIYEFFADNYNLGNVLKYLLRADKKGNRQEDLEKALKYLSWEVERGRSE